MVAEADTVSSSWMEKEAEQQRDDTVSWLAQMKVNDRHCASSSADSDSDYDPPRSFVFQPAVPLVQPLIQPPPPLPLTAATVVQQPASPTATVVSTSDRPHICHHVGCNKAYYKLGKLNRHLATHSDTRLHTCPHTGCTRAFHRADHLHRHLLSHSNDRRYTCQQAACGRAFLTSTHLRRHMKTHDCAYHCTVDGCGHSFNKHARLTQHQLQQHSQHASTAQLVCPHQPCTLSFTSRTLLSKHVRLCHLPHRYTCVDCLASFARHLEWRRHRRQHEDELVPCPTCFQHIARKRLSQHQHSHTTAAFPTAAVYECEVGGCERRFVSVSGLKAHLRAVHREEGDGFECDECGREFGYRSVLIRHVASVHGQEGGEGRKRRVSEKDKAFGRLAKRAKLQEGEKGEREEGEEGEEEEEKSEVVSEPGQVRMMDGESEERDGGERDSERDTMLVTSAHGTAICVM